MNDLSTLRRRGDPRDALTSVTCDSRSSPKCRGTYRVSLRAEAKNRARNDGTFLCLQCSRRLKFSGRSNPNARHLSLDDALFERIDSEGKAYLLGWIASDGSISRGTIQLYIHPKDTEVVYQWLRILGTSLPIVRRPRLVGIQICSRRIVDDVCRWLDIQSGKKSATVGFPQLHDDQLKWAFLRGYFDGDGSVVAPTQARGPRCKITTNSTRLRQAILAFCGIPGSLSADQIEWGGNHALDLLAKLYDGATWRLARKFGLYLDWCMWVPSLSGTGRSGRDDLFRWVKALPDAVAPSKMRASDSGYDLTVVRLLKKHGQVEFYDTGIKVQPAFGWYFDVVARSSLSKTGYMLANAVGVIDRTYTGTIVVPLIKVDPASLELELPARIAQMIPRPIVHVQFVQVDTLDATERGSGGFGSTT